MGGGGGGGENVGRYVEYAYPLPSLLNSSEIGAVYDSRPSGISKPFHKCRIDGVDFFMTIHWVCDSPFAALLQILLIGFYKSG